MGIEEEVGILLKQRGLTLAVAESCTGGMLGQLVTAVSGSSDYFLGGVIAYSNGAKTMLLAVDPDIIAEHGAVSAETAARMARGVREKFCASIGLSITGIAGPSGGSADKPVGLVFIGLDDEAGGLVERFNFEGGRGMIRRRAADGALGLLRNRLLERK